MRALLVEDDDTIAAFVERAAIVILRHTRI